MLTVTLPLHNAELSQLVEKGYDDELDLLHNTRCYTPHPILFMK